MSFGYKGMLFTDQAGPFVRHMPTLNDHRETLKTLQGSWDTLSLLGHLSHTRANLGKTREAFDKLTGELMTTLADETLARTTSGLGYKAQVAVDILTRNLFERTADIGFLATDAAVAAAAASNDPEQLAALRVRFRRYASRYSVYRDIVLLAPGGQVLARMNDGFSGRSTSDIVSRAATSRGFVETYAPTDFCDGHALTYASAVGQSTLQTAGVLVLVFDLIDEVRRVFERLAVGDELFAFVDSAGLVVASNDAVRLPPGSRAPQPRASAHVRLAGQSYVAVQRRPQPYQGYEGPGWTALAMVPCDVAFEPVTTNAEAAFSGDGIFSERMRSIPLQASAIQGNLDCIVWNGHLLKGAVAGHHSDRRDNQRDGNHQQPAAADSSAHDFSRALLAEIAATGRRTQGVFEAATAELLATVTATMLEEAQLLSGLAVDIFDRNLYERACDCRWWTEDATLAALDPAASAAVLSHINSLYTVYTDILLFDAEGRMLASSGNPSRVGDVLADGWVASYLKAGNQASYAVSPFEASALYGGRATYVYTAPIRVDGFTVGGVGLVFDSEPQFLAMLEAARPTRAGSIAAFLRPDGSVIGATAGLPVALPKKVLSLRGGESWSGTLVSDGECFAVGATASSGYREFKTSDGYVDDVIAIIAVPCGLLETGAEAKRLALAAVPDGTEIATFYIGSQAAGILARDVVECIELKQAIHPSAGQNPGARRQGYIAWRNQALPLVDIGHELGETGSTHRHAVVLQHLGRHFGLLVSDLGEIVPLQLSPAPAATRLQGGLELITTLAQSGGALLPLLSVGCIAALSVARSAAQAGARAASA
ncbi:hypothetical protein BH11PSE9_BH11PSE9_15750 [soil metagenome]